MQVIGLGHVNIRTPDFDATVAFYERLGLIAGPATSSTARPQNVWLHDAAGRAILHVNGPLPHEPVHPAGGASRLDHFAIDCADLAQCEALLTAAGVPFERIHLAARAMIQLNVHDPNGIKVELTFDAAAAGVTP